MNSSSFQNMTKVENYVHLYLTTYCKKADLSSLPNNAWLRDRNNVHCYFLAVEALNFPEMASMWCQALSCCHLSSKASRAYDDAYLATKSKKLGKLAKPIHNYVEY